MSKKQKIWLTIFLAMFAVPELLWGELRSFIHLFFMFDSTKSSDSLLSFNLLPASNNAFLNILTSMVELLGLIGLSFFALNLKINNKYLKITILIFLLLMIAIDALAVFLVYFYSFNAPQIG